MKKHEVQYQMEIIEDRCKSLKRVLNSLTIDSTATETINELLAKIEGAAASVKAETATKKLMTTGIISDDELLARFASVSVWAGERSFEATMIPNGEVSNVDNWDRRYFTAPNKAEAVKIAREYAERIAKKKLVYVYLAH